MTTSDITGKKYYYEFCILIHNYVFIRSVTTAMH